MEQRQKPFYLSSPPFQTIINTSKLTGLSQSYLRKGCKDGSVPHIQSGQKYLVNIPRLLENLNALPGDRG